MRYISIRQLFCCIVLAVFVHCSATVARAQFDDAFGSSLDPGLGASLYASDQQQGFSFNFDQSTANFANPSYHTAISDPLHTYQMDSGISSKYDPLAPSTIYATPFAYTLTTSDAAFGLNDLSRGEHSLRFAAGVQNLLGRTGSLGPQRAQPTIGANALGAAFSGGLGTSAEFSGNPFRRESSAGIGAPADALTASAVSSGIAPETQPMATAAPLSPASGMGAATVSGSDMASSTGIVTADLELGQPIPSPVADAASFYGESASAAPLAGIGSSSELPLDDETIGQLSVAPPRPLLYTASTSGFSDSTRGNAALPPDSALSSSPFGSPVSVVAASPFAPVSEGNVFGVHESVSPNLHAVPMLPTPPSFRSFERHLQQERIASGDRSLLDVATQSAEDKLAYKRMYGHRQNAPHDTMPDSAAGAYGGGADAPIR